MAFKIKDLMISVLAAKGAGQKEICDDSCPELSCDIGTNGCDITHCSVHACTFNTACTVCSRNSCEASARLPQSTRLRASDLPKPKAQLRRALKQVEAREQTVAKKLQPQSVEQIEMLETKLVPFHLADLEILERDAFPSRHPSRRHAGYAQNSAIHQLLARVNRG
ncbi:MAG TPA: hypothetical protein VN902_23925 [Candidatus Acidoferrales bacterium]|jgi:hypothetical protein|nr:hypothetical protein [Candidatus Acidoferrales bacterium]